MNTRQRLFRRTSALAILPTLFLILAPSAALANTTEDLLGLGGRTNAMGGAGTALAMDPSATYFGPANLAFCGRDTASVAFSHTHYGLNVDLQPGDPAAKPTRDQSRLTFGLCSLLPYGMAIGVLFGMNLQDPMTLDIATTSNEPQFALYGDPLEQLTIIVGGAWRPIDELSVGIGASILVNSVLNFDAFIPVAQEEETFASEIIWNLDPTAALHASIHATPLRDLHLAATYRGALFHDLNAPASVDVLLAGVFLEVELLLEAATWFSPQQLAFGATYDPLDFVTLAADLTWYDWSSYAGPFIVATPVGGDDAAANALAFPQGEDANFSDIVQPRLGVEARFLDDALAVRAGYSFRPTPAPLPSGNTNILDNDVHVYSFGLGYQLGPRLGQDHDERVTRTQPLSMSVDAFVRLSQMSQQRVLRAPQTSTTTGQEEAALTDFNFGGNVLQAGVGVSFGWD